jgi:peptidoglycan/xylan/chitin deacetylase (PgdA/CDA1 family)
MYCTIGVLFAAGALVAFLLYGVPVLARLRKQAWLAAQCRQQRAVVMTYDDGPGERTTHGVLDRLEAAGVRATFFPLGVRAAAQPELMSHLAESGHEIGCHSETHRNAWRVSPLTAARDAQRGVRTLRRWRVDVRLFRPPHGKLDSLTWALLRTKGLRLAWWTHDSGDTFASCPDAEAFAETVARAGGGVVLMHDFDRESDRGDYVVEVTAQLIRAAHRSGLRIMPLGELLGLPAARSDT